MPTSHLKNIAIVGATGRVGQAFAEALVATGEHTVTALTRNESKSKLPRGVIPVQVDYNDETNLIEVLKGQQFLIITLSVQAPPDLHSKIVQAAFKAGIQWVVPNAYGGDNKNEKFANETLYGEQTFAKFRELEGLGISYIPFCCGFWYEWSLALPEPWFGFNITKRTVTFFDDGNTKISVSTWNQCGRAMAALLTLPEGAAKPALSDWRNNPLYVASFRISQRDMLDSLHRVLETTDKDWTISHEPTADRYKRGLSEIKEGIMTGFATAMYSRTFFPTGEGDFHGRGLANQALGLPEESLDEATKRAVDMVESGWNPFAGIELPEPQEWSRASK